MMMQILWAVSSVGKGHVIRDISIVEKLKKRSDIEIDWLAPDPAGVFLKERGYHVLEASAKLKGSGKVYHNIFKECKDVFNLTEYIKADTKLHQHDFEISESVWKGKKYDLLVGDEAFWLLSGFASNWGKKPAPFIFITDFIGTKTIKHHFSDRITTWINNLKFTYSHIGADLFVYIGYKEEIPDKRLGMFLPKGNQWAEKHCCFIKPIANFDPETIESKTELRKKLRLPLNSQIMIAQVGPEGQYKKRIGIIEKVFEQLRKEYPNTYFLMVCPEKGTKKWIHYHQYLDKLYRYFAASDFAIIQSGYGKIIELSALGIPFLAIPLDYHFEQEYIMKHRLKYYGTGKLLELRKHSPEKIASLAKEMMHLTVQPIKVDNGCEMASIILNMKN